MAAHGLCPVESYARAVVSGEIVAGRLVGLACERHLRDLETGHERGLRWDRDAAERRIAFNRQLKLPSGKPFVFEPFQEFIYGSLHGWKLTDGSRRFRDAYIETGKGSGKTPGAASEGLYGLVADGEGAAEVYSAATRRDQAKITFRDAVLMAKSSGLSKRLEITDHNILFNLTSSFFRPVAAEHKALDGLRVHVGLIDELHEHPTSLVVDKIKAGTKNRRQPLIFRITNSGFDRNSVCWQEHEYSVKVLEDTLQDDSWFAYVCTLDPCEKCRAEGKTQPKQGCPDCDQWDDETVWIKANPGLDTILPRRYLREQVRIAKGMPAKLNLILRLNFCVWTEGEDRAISMDQWSKCSAVHDPISWRADMLERLQRRMCVGGLDLGSTGDLTSLVLLFPPDGEEWPKWIAIPWFWLPDISARKRVERDRVPYDLWIRQGFITETEGDVTDYDQVRADITGVGGLDGASCLAEQFSIREIAVDRTFNGAHLCTQLTGDGIEIIAFGQGFLSMAAPVKHLLEMIGKGEIEHGNNPVLTWMASNAVTISDPAGNLKFDKSKSIEKIDGLVALTMATGQLIQTPIGPAESYYDDHPLEYA